MKKWWIVGVALLAIVSNAVAYAQVQTVLKRVDIEYNILVGSPVIEVYSDMALTQPVNRLQLDVMPGTTTEKELFIRNNGTATANITAVVTATDNLTVWPNFGELLPQTSGNFFVRIFVPFGTPSGIRAASIEWVTR